MNTDALPRLPLGDWVETVVDWLTTTLEPLFSVIQAILLGSYEGLDWVLTTPPWWVILVILVALSYWAKGWKLALGSLIGLVFIATLDQWENAMDTLALVLVAAVIALIVGIPLGIWAAKSDRVSAVLRPILDFLQTMPAFVYLIPTVVIFTTGATPGIVATIIFAIAPGVRMTELGIRQVDAEVVEAGQAFGATPGRILRQIQLPLATPTIMAGVNQVIMLALSMVVIAGMVGADGLGKDVVASLSQVDIALGSEAGLAVVVLAMILDRITGGFGSRSARRTARKATSSARKAKATAVA